MTSGFSAHDCDEGRTASEPGRGSVLYVADRISLRGGADQHLLQVIDWAVSLGFEVTVVAGSCRDDEHRLLPQGVRFVRVKCLSKAVRSEGGLGRLRELVEGSDVVHVQNVMNPLALEVATAAKRALVTVQDHRFFCPGMGKTLPDGRRCETVMSADACSKCLPDAAYRSRTLELTEARGGALRGSTLVVLSQYMASELEAIGLRGAQVVPPWVDVDESAETGTGEGFVLAGRLVKHKGVHAAREAWKSSGTSQPLVVAGSGPLESELEGATMLGWLPAEQLRRVLRRARALLFPSFWQEPFGIVAVEALAEGTPVIVAESGGTGEWSSHGCLRIPGDVGEMAEAISLLAAEPEHAFRLGLAGRAFVAKKFGRSRVETRLVGLYSQ